MADFAERLSRLGTENAFVVLGKVKKLQAEGVDILSFGVGEPEFDTPENIKQAGIKAIQDNQTHYAPSAGIFEFRESIAKYISKTRNVPVHADNIVVMPGGKPVIFLTMLTLLNEGDEVIYPNPGYPIYESVAEFVGAKAVPYAILESKGFSMDVDEIEKLITPKTKLLVINSP
ncbi:aminotransferase class I/II-fold pyridoxal phosphate-dependent enzyme, partial [Candidatus Woesearchaeota archaeon]